MFFVWGDTLMLSVIKVMANTKQPFLQNCKELKKNPPLYQQDQMQGNWEQCFSRAGMASQDPQTVGRMLFHLPSWLGGWLCHCGLAAVLAQLLGSSAGLSTPFVTCSKGWHLEHPASRSTIQTLLNLLHFFLNVLRAIKMLFWVREWKGRKNYPLRISCCMQGVSLEAFRGFLI